jgi:hypothetical protein
MAGWFETATDALTLLAFWSAFPRYSDLGAITGVEAGGGTIVTSPLYFTVPANAPIGTVVGTISVTGGVSPTYTYSLTYDQLGYFTIVGNELRVNAPLVAGTDNIVITATGSTGDTLQLPTIVIITPVGYVPTYHLYGF